MITLILDCGLDDPQRQTGFDSPDDHTVVVNRVKKKKFIFLLHMVLLYMYIYVSKGYTHIDRCTLNFTDANNTASLSSST